MSDVEVWGDSEHAGTHTHSHSHTLLTPTQPGCTDSPLVYVLTGKLFVAVTPTQVLIQHFRLNDWLLPARALGRQRDAG